MMPVSGGQGAMDLTGDPRCPEKDSRENYFYGGFLRNLREWITGFHENIRFTVETEGDGHLPFLVFDIQGVSKIHGINSGMSSSHVDNQNSLYQHRSGNV
jgi:hypothetical protein